MGFRFRKSFKVAPGIRLNVSKSGLSTSVGPRGAKVNFSSRGTRVSAKVGPVYYQEYLSSKKRSTRPDPLDGQKMSISKNEDGTINCPRCSNNMGQPHTNGFLVKKTFYVCPSCNLKAEVNT